jgi:hypothetical protein
MRSAQLMRVVCGRLSAPRKAALSGRPELSVTAILAAGHLTSLVDERDRELRAKLILSWVMPA